MHDSEQLQKHLSVGTVTTSRRIVCEYVEEKSPSGGLISVSNETIAKRKKDSEFELIGNLSLNSFGLSFFKALLKTHKNVNRLAETSN